MARRSFAANENYSRSRALGRPAALPYHCGVTAYLDIAAATKRPMHTPQGFTPSHARPDALPADTLAFAFRDDKILVGGLRGRAFGARSRRRSMASASPATGTIWASSPASPASRFPLPPSAPEPAGWRYAGLRSLFFRLPEPLLAIAARAFQVVEWDRTHRYCGRCGTPTRDKAGERAKECPACGYVAYPRVTPAMMVLVTRGREVLLARAPRFPPGMYSALAGFVEPGETIEDCIHREVREEVGHRGRRHPLFREPVVGVPPFADDRLHRRIRRRRAPADPTEIAEAKWFAWDAVPRLPPSISISRRLIEATVARLGSESGRPC